MTALVDDIAKYAQAGADALKSLEYRADFSIASLRDVDWFFDDHSINGELKPDGELAEDTGPRIFALGAYVGETIRRAYGGEWKSVQKAPNSEWDTELHLPQGSVIWPFQRAAKRFRNGSEDGIYAYAVLVRPDKSKSPVEQRPWWKFW